MRKFLLLRQAWFCGRYCQRVDFSHHFSGIPCEGRPICLKCHFFVWINVADSLSSALLNLISEMIFDTPFGSCGWKETEEKSKAPDVEQFGDFQAIAPLECSFLLLIIFSFCGILWCTYFPKMGLFSVTSLSNCDRWNNIGMPRHCLALLKLLKTLSI